MTGHSRFTQGLAGLCAGFMLLLAGAGAAAAATGPLEMLRATSDEMLARLDQQREAIDQRPDYLFELVEEVLVPHVDLQRMSQWVLGKYWRQASPAQRERFSEEFKTLLVRFYVSALLEDPKQLDRLLAQGDALISYEPPREVDEDRARVRADIHLPSGQTVPVLFSMLQEEGRWKIYDVNVEGISLVANYRSSFSTEIRRDGLETVIKDLERRNRELLEKVNGNHSAGT